MICRNCQAEVDDDLIFCTNCGERLFEAPGEADTVLLNNQATAANDAAATQNQAAQRPPKSTSRLKWVALIVALVAIPASIFGLLLLQSRNRQTPPAANRPATPTPAKTPTANRPANVNANKANTNTNVNASKSPAKNKEIMNERIGIAPKEHYAVPFAVEDQNARLTGKVTVIEGERVEVFVYLKSEYDEYFPDPDHKVAGYETRRSEEIDQVLVEEDYVLVFVNKTDKPLTIQGNFGLEPMKTAAK